MRGAAGLIGGALERPGVGFGEGPGGPGARRRGGPGGELGAPSGTYVAILRPGGGVLAERVLQLDADTGAAKPDVPDDVPADRIVTVGGTGATDYRLLARRDPVTGLTGVVAVPLRDTAATLHRLLLVEALVIAGVLVALALVARLVVRVGLLPLERMGHTADAIAGGDLSHRVADTDERTEVGRLGLALNAMLDRLEDAFRRREASEDKLRRFLADASHELRTPLASIRGYAELFRMGAVDDEAGRARALGRIEDEATRMGVLVEDLLTLARLDEVADAPHVPVDVAALVRDAASDARAAAPDRRIDAHAEPPLTVVGDADQLRQVLGNLLRNAVAHTPPGTPVEVSARTDGGQVRLEVRDHGPGLPATADPEELFGRFWRAEGGRTRGRAGAGLGLAIVAAIVAAHGGSVQARDAEGGGASFVVRLPVAAASA